MAKRKINTQVKTVTNTNGVPKLPNVSDITNGDFVVNYQKGDETIHIKNNNNEIVDFYKSDENYDFEVKLEKQINDVNNVNLYKSSNSLINSSELKFYTDLGISTIQYDIDNETLFYTDQKVWKILSYDSISHGYNTFKVQLVYDNVSRYDNVNKIAFIDGDKYKVRCGICYLGEFMGIGDLLDKCRIKGLVDNENIHRLVGHLKTSSDKKSHVFIDNQLDVNRGYIKQTINNGNKVQVRTLNIYSTESNSEWDLFVTAGLMNSDPFNIKVTQNTNNVSLQLLDFFNGSIGGNNKLPLATNNKCGLLSAKGQVILEMLAENVDVKYVSSNEYYYLPDTSGGWFLKQAVSKNTIVIPTDMDVWYWSKYGYVSKNDTYISNYKKDIFSLKS